MDGFFKKFSIYDFFNLLGAGGIFIVGLHAIEVISIQQWLHYFGTDNQIVSTAIVLILCYLFGALFQQCGLFICDRWLDHSRKLTSSFLTDNAEIIGNGVRQTVHRQLARELLKKKCGETQEGDFTPEQSNYYFTYCVYYIQVKDQQKKAEKMRELKALSMLLMVCFGALALVALLRVAYYIAFTPEITRVALAHYGVDFILALILAVVYYNAYKRNTRNWVRMVLSVYEVCTESYITEKEEICDVQ